MTAAEAGIATNTAGVASLDAREPFAVTARGENGSVTLTDVVVVSATVTAPAAGQVTVNSTARANEDTDQDGVRCSITTAATPPELNNSYLQWWTSGGLGVMTGDVVLER